jgi:hypothetical protein
VVRKPPNADSTLSVGVIVGADEGVRWELSGEESNTPTARKRRRVRSTGADISWNDPDVRSLLWCTRLSLSVESHCLDSKAYGTATFFCVPL